jgi:hypothetical protein
MESLPSCWSASGFKERSRRGPGFGLSCGAHFLIRFGEIPTSWYVFGREKEVLVQIFLSVCFCRASDFADFRPPRPRSTFPER